MPQMSRWHRCLGCGNYLAASGHERALLIDFGAARVVHRRCILTKPAAPELPEPS
jgi:hypothetical protein